MTKSQFILIAAFGSFALLAGAFLFQFSGYAPCQMCLWQRYPHAVAVVIGLLALILTRFQTQLAILGALAALTTGAIGVYHTGVERDWWEGPSSCTGGGGLNLTDPLSTDIAPIVMCDDVVWSLLGLSMASYNALISLVLAGLWIKAALR
ncbi:disulfide bond formation protein B [Octadecabacter ascidiaceicola]|uniref:Disulfide bond formation protein B n=1 Tax=Octadecabacter ascidiaceicola TaxID=1655543 RepID=A0A238JKE2_9RHOB|nr:disulfide bond formation protein B [Octadecabacter ascidiaceicola]SMX31129.1 disulfide bond formation protein B [Octadecabacter ascidiaceicola]